MSPQADRRTRTMLWLALGVALLWSGYRPYDRFTWVMEIFPVPLVAAWVLATRRRYPLTLLLTTLLTVHAIVLMIGGHYSYARVPLFDTLKTMFSWSRNNYDRVGHFLQGFVPAILAREILLRHRVVTSKKWLAFIVLSICLAFSACYELLEWTVASLTGEAAESFLGTQGDLWDTQKDMAMAGLGALLAVLFLSKAHDNALAAKEKMHG